MEEDDLVVRRLLESIELSPRATEGLAARIGGGEDVAAIATSDTECATDEELEIVLAAAVQWALENGDDYGPCGPYLTVAWLLGAARRREDFVALVTQLDREFDVEDPLNMIQDDPAFVGGLVFSTWGELDKSINWLQRAATREPTTRYNRAVALACLASVYHEAERWSEAIESYRDAVDIMMMEEVFSLSRRSTLERLRTLAEEHRSLPPNVDRGISGLIWSPHPV